MRFQLALWILASLFAAPSTALACSCVRPYPAGHPPPSHHWTDRPYIFVGHVLEVDKTLTQSTRLTVRFVTETSWRGAMPDTVTLLVRDNAPCAYYTAGGRYLVLADRDTASPSALVTASCDDSWSIHYAGRRLAELGAPTWTAPRMGQRVLDERAVRLGESRKPRFLTDSLVIGVSRDSDMVRFEIADWAGPPSRNVTLLYLTPGLYQFRITWTDGTTYESYLSLRCESPRSGHPCSVFRFFSDLRPAS